MNGGGLLYRLPLDAPQLEQVNTGAATRCNNDHGITPDGSQFILSSHHEGRGSQIYRVPVGGLIILVLGFYNNFRVLDGLGSADMNYEHSVSPFIPYKFIWDD